MRTNVEVDRKLGEMFEIFHNQPARAPEKAAAGRAAFLAEAKNIAAEKTIAIPVSPRAELRHIGWMQKIQSVFTAGRKERSPMFGTLGTVILIFSLLFGGTGITVAAAQDSLPDQPLYQVKLMSENVRAGMTYGETHRLKLALDLAERRAEEMQEMFQAGQTPPLAVQARWEGELEEALRLAAGLVQDPQFQVHLEKIQTMLQEQLRAFEQIGPQQDPEGEALLTRTRSMLGETLQLCQQGQQAPALFQKMVQERLNKQDQEGQQNGKPSGNPVKEQKKEQAGEQKQEQNQDCVPNANCAGEQNQEQNQEQNGEPSGDQNQLQNQEQNGGSSDAPYQEQNQEQNGASGESGGPGNQNQEQNGDGPGGPNGSGEGAGDGGGSGSTDPGSDNTGGTNSGSDSTGSGSTGGDASGPEGSGGSEGSGGNGGSGGG